MIIIDFLKNLFGFISIVKAEYDKKNEILTITYSNNNIKQYEGNCTVWHNYPLMIRCNAFKEMELYDIWSYINKHGNPYPNSHKLNNTKT